MRNKLLFALAIIGILAGFVSAYIFSIKQKPLPPAFKPASNPYEKGIYANGIIESYQTSGENINIYPEVPGTVTRILVAEGQHVKAGIPLLMLDDSVQRATAEQQKAQAESAREQIGLAKANLKSLQDTLDKQKKSYDLDPKSVSKDVLDTAQNAVEVAKANVDVAQKQYEAALKAYQASNVLLSKYLIKAPSDGAALSINTAVGSYISSLGSYDSYTGEALPPIVMGNLQNYIGVRCYIDEILISRLPQPAKMRARMFIRGTNITIPLEYVRAQPYVSPKIELSNQRTERVDVRVLPVIFRFVQPKDISLYPGQLVDVYIGDE
ncbi:MAG: efflux RND transporter periplasmic adaptor subunit [Gallionellaceae bacterium]